MAMTRPAPHRISHWIAPSRVRDSAPAIDRRRLPPTKRTDELSGIFPAPTEARCKGTQPKGGLAKSVIAKLKRVQNQAVCAVSEVSASFRLHSIKPPSMVNFENGDCGVATCNAAKNCESPGLLRKKRMWPAESESRDNHTMPENSATMIWAYWPESACPNS